MAKATLMFLVVIVTALMSAQPVSAAALTSVVEDPVGDWIFPGITGQPYQDIIRAAITLKDGRFILVMDLVAPIPDTPVLPPGTVLLDWSWALNTNTATFPAGFPFPPGFARAPEYIVQFLWDGTKFTGQLIDRTPLLTGEPPVVTELSFSIKGAGLKTSVEAAMIGNPSSFLWLSVARIWRTELGTVAEIALDGAPDAGFTSWPS